MTAIGALLALLLPFAAPALSAQAAGEQAPADTATLIVAHRAIITFRASHLGRPPSARVAGAITRIRNAARAGTLSDPIAVQPTEEGRMVTYGGRPLFQVLPGDVDPLVAQDLDASAQEAVRQLEQARSELIEQRSLGMLARSLGLALLATLAFVLVIRGLRWGGRRIRARAQARAAREAGRVHLGGFHLLNARQVAAVAGWLIIAAGWAAGLLAGYLWLTFVLRSFPWTRPWGEVLGAFLGRSAGMLLSGIAAAIPGLLVVALIFVLAWWLSQLVRAFFRSVEEGRTEVPWLDREVAAPSRRIANTVVWLFALVAAYPYLPGSDSAVFKGLSVLIGVMLSIGSGSLIGQAMSGLALMYSRGLRPGDYVRIDDVEGRVTALGMLSTKLATARGETITIPNGVVLGTKTVNYSRDVAGACISSAVTIGYDSPWRQVHAMLLEAAAATAGVRADPAPEVVQRELGDFAVAYELRAWPDPAEPRVRVLSRLNANIQDAFNRYGVQIMTPHYEGDPEGPKLVPKDQWHLAPASGGDGGAAAKQEQGR
ncbi:MAG: mechanosensitive ion channel family protein [Gemmatimonadales bacterium]